MNQEVTARRALREAHRMVVKVGTHVVTNDDSELAVGRVASLVEGLASERKAGREPELVDHLVTYSLVKRQSAAVPKAD